MALQIWLPLDGDIRNLGVSGANISVMGTGVTFTDGKIGKAATFPNSCASCLYTQGLKLQVFSWTAWINVFGEGSGSSQRIISEGRDTGSVGTNIYTNKAGTTLCWTTHKKNGSTPIELNRWYHVVLTADGSNIRFYIDGELKSTTTYTEDSDYAQSNNAFVLGKMAYSYTSTGSYFPFNGQLNDVRVYDHCLSVAEVKELSQGLILHYKLDESYPLINRNMLMDAPKSYSSSGYEAYKLNMTENMVEGQTYTLQFWDVDISHSGKTEITIGLGVYWGGGGCELKKLNGTDYFIDGHADHITYTFTITHAQATHANASNQWLNIYNSVPDATGTKNMHIGKWKLEKGSIATDYIECDLSNKANNPFVVTDSSGYGHHGTAINTIGYSDDSPKYTSSCNLTASSSYITGNYFASEFITFSLWVKFTTLKASHIIDARTSDSGYQPFYYNGTNSTPYIQCGGTHGYPNFNYTFETNRWYYVCIRYDSSSVKCYVDGIQVGTSSSGKGTALNAVYPFYLATRFNQANYSDVYISDFRIYCTALSAEDILDLYHTSAKIDKTGKVHTFEFVEDEGMKITKTGITKAKQITEYLVLEKLKYDPITYIEPDGSAWVRIFHHNNPASKSFSSSNDFANSVYIDEDRWFNMEVCNSLATWEIMVKSKKTAEDTESKFRWIQSVNPMTATFNDVGSSNITKVTTGGYTTSSFGGLYLKNQNAYLAANNGNSGNWWGAVGAWVVWGNGLPGYVASGSSGADAISTGFEDVYVRIDNQDMNNPSLAKFKKLKSISANDFIEK